jgi:hypothetical protein
MAQHQAESGFEPRGHNTAVRAAGADPLRIGRTPIHFFAVAILFFAGAAAALPFVTPRIAEYFYQPAPLALTHTITLGWITAAVMGVMYRYVPSLTRRPIPFPRAAIVQCVIYAVGVSGIVAHFAIGIWFGIWLAAIVLIVAIVIFAVNMFSCLWPRVGDGVAETGMFLAVCFLLLAASLGFTLALDKSYDFLGGSVLTNLASHVHLAAVGWVTMVIVAVSYRMLPAFLLPKVTIPRDAIWQIYALAAAVLGLAFTLLCGLRGAPVWAILIVLSLGCYVDTIRRMVGARRMPLDWTTRHALAGLGWLGASAVLGVALSFTGAQSETGARIVSAYGFAGLLGFITNFIIGMSYQLFAGFVTRVRAGQGWMAVTIAELSKARPRPFVFVAFNGGLAITVAGLLAGWPPAAVAGAAAVGGAGIVYAVVTMWTLSFAYRRAVPRAARSELRVVPS